MKMDALLLMVYILIWPVISFGVLALIWGAMYIEWRNAKKAGRDLV